ncbi:protein of unknown function [Methylacidimicrobium sp. AP8]|nr:protein of unknown function [Methylacidimicrobium sp. AP8]
MPGKADARILRESPVSERNAPLPVKKGDRPATGKGTCPTNQASDAAFAAPRAPGRGRTCNLWLRRPTLYPIELRVLEDAPAERAVRNG